MWSSNKLVEIPVNENHLTAQKYLKISDGFFKSNGHLKEDMELMESLGIKIKKLEKSNFDFSLIYSFLTPDSLIMTWSKTHQKGFDAIFPKRFGLDLGNGPVKLIGRENPVKYINPLDEGFSMMLAIYRAGRIMEI